MLATFSSHVAGLLLKLPSQGLNVYLSGGKLALFVSALG